MTDQEGMEMLRAVLASRRGVPEPTPDCLDDDTVAAMAEGSLGPELRSAALEHLAECAHCEGVVASIARALADPAVAREVRGAVGPWRRFRIALPAAAAAVLLLLVWSRPPDDGAPHRSPPTGSLTPLPVSPLGTVADAEVLRWTSLAGVDRYRVTLFDAEGRVLYETLLNDTVAALPDSIVLVPRRPYLWKVEARTGWDRWSASDLVEFSIAGGAPP